MIIVLSIIFIALMMVGIIVNRRTEDYTWTFSYGMTIFIIILSIVGIIACGLAATVLGVEIQKANIYDVQIESLTARADLIADQVDAAVDKCIEYESESNVFSDIVFNLMNSYTQTTDTIAELQTKQSKLSIWRWWLYFGN